MYMLMRLLGLFSLSRDISRTVSGHPEAMLGQVPRAYRMYKKFSRRRF